LERIMNPALFLLLIATVVFAAAGAVKAPLGRPATSVGDGPLPSSDTVRFPAVRGANLSFEEYQLPADFEGELNFVMVAFERWHQRLVNTWLPLARELDAEHAGLAYYELPVVPDRGERARTYLDNVMRAGIQDPKARATTITLYTDVGRFVETLDLGTARNVHVMLVDRQGTVLWRASGERTAAAEQALRQVLADRKSGGGAGPADAL
jgi:hypothetical protein